jgi:hypothetical protein
MKVSIGGKERDISVEDFRSACERQGVKMDISASRIVLTGQEEKVRYARMILDASAELEKAIIDAIGSRAPEMFNGLFVIDEGRLPNGERNLLVSKTPDGPGLYWIRETKGENA